MAIAVSSAHRQAAFEAGQWLIDTMKRVVPIWKLEHYTDGTRQWVEHGNVQGAAKQGVVRGEAVRGSSDPEVTGA